MIKQHRRKFQHNRFLILALFLCAVFISCGRSPKSGQEEFALGETAYAEQDYETAAKWFLKAAEQGNAEAQTRIADCFWNGQGVEQDKAVLSPG